MLTIGGGGVMLLTNASVQEELKVTDEQKEKLREFGDEQRQKMQERMQDLRGGGAPDFEKIQAEMRKYEKWARPFQPVRILDMLPLSHLFGQSLGIFIPPYVECICRSYLDKLSIGVGVCVHTRLDIDGKIHE